MKKNLNNVENQNTVVENQNSTIEMAMQIDNETVGVVMDEETKEAIIEDNIHVVPKNRRKQFDALSLDEKIGKIQYYQDRQKMIEEWKMKASIEYKVKELLVRKKATTADAKAIINICNEWIDNARTREIARLDEEIARLEAMKQSLN